jgi:hypothetical protein
MAVVKNCITGLANGVKQCLKADMNIFDHDRQFVARNRHILNHERGSGYWLWKPYILLKELYLASEGDIIIYSDAAVNFVENITHLIRLTQNQDVIVFEQDWKVID